MSRPTHDASGQPAPPGVTHPLAERRIRIAPSILSADFGRLADATAQMERAGAEMLHLDVMDGHFVPNISFGVPVIASLRAHTPLFFDAHLMIEEPKRYVEAFAAAGCNHVTFHIEVSDDPGEVIQRIHDQGISAGIAMNPTTPVSAIDSVIDQVELVLVMSVWPGFGGQKFIADVLPNVEQLRDRLAPHQRLEIDGGIDAETIGRAALAGADTFVAGTAIFGSASPAAAFERLRTLGSSAGKFVDGR